MAKQDIIVVGASAGGLEVLREIASGLPSDLLASLLVVVHIGAGTDGHSYLPEILSHAGPLPAIQASQNQRIEPGRIYVARPDYHLLVEPGRICISNGPKENLARPAINPLFRSAANAYGPRVAGVILSGQLDDGVAGLAEIKRRGGVAVVQSPETALYPSMPSTALKYITADFVVKPAGVASVLRELAATDRAQGEEAIEPMIRSQSTLTCPECRGPLWEERQGKIVEYRCRVGHAYSELALVEEHRSTVERAIWATIVALEEEADIDERLFSNVDQPAAARARSRRAKIAALRESLVQLKIQYESEHSAVRNVAR